MKRESLKELGLNEEQIKKIMDINGADIEKAKGDSAEASKENESLRSQIKERDKDLKHLRKQVEDNKDLTEQLNNLKDKYDKDTADLNTKLSHVRLNSAIDRSLSKDKVRNIKAIKGLLDMDSIKLDKDGNLTGLQDQVEDIKKSDPYLFDQGQKEDYKPDNGKPAKTSEAQTMIDVFKGDIK